MTEVEKKPPCLGRCCHKSRCYKGGRIVCHGPTHWVDGEHSKTEPVPEVGDQ